MEDIKSVVYAKDVIEFVTVGVQYCAYLEQAPGERSDFVNTLSRLLPLLYLKATLLPRVGEGAEDFYPEEFVTEQDYEQVRSQIAFLLGTHDSYLDLDITNLQYVQEPQLKTISEDLADVYQAVRNFVTTYKLDLESSMYEGLLQITEQFDLYWGQVLLNALRALHGVRAVLERGDEFDDEMQDTAYDR